MDYRGEADVWLCMQRLANLVEVSMGAPINKTDVYNSIIKKAFENMQHKLIEANLTFDTDYVVYKFEGSGINRNPNTLKVEYDTKESAIIGKITEHSTEVFRIKINDTVSNIKCIETLQSIFETMELQYEVYGNFGNFRMPFDLTLEV